MEYVPPRWIRRLVITPIVFVVALVFTVASPLIHLVAAALDLIFDRRRFRITRLVGIALAFCVAEVFGLFALFTVWVGSGFGLRMNRPLWVKSNNLLAGQYMELVTRAIIFFVGFEFTLTFEDRETARDVAAATLRAAMAKVNTAKRQIAAYEAEARRIRTLIDDTRLTSPVEGRVLYRLLEPGEVAAAGGALM